MLIINNNETNRVKLIGTYVVNFYSVQKCFNTQKEVIQCGIKNTIYNFQSYLLILFLYF